MRRREFLGVLGTAGIGWPLAAAAQQPERMRHIGLLMAAGADDPEYQARIRAFQQELEQLGWTEGRNAWIDTRWATTNADEIRKHASELAASRRTSSWLLQAPQPWRRCWRRPAPCRLYSSFL
jgi:putative ABC transport system substrate-binding protein